MVVGVGVAHAVAAEAVALGQGADGDGAFPHTGQGAGRNELDAVEDVIFECLVTNQNQIVLDDELSQLHQVFLAVNHGGGVVGMGQQDHLGLVGDALFHLFNADAVVVLGIGGDTDGHAGQQLAVQVVTGIAGVGDQNLVAFADEGHHGEQQTAVRAGVDDDVTAGIDGTADALGNVLSQSLTQLVHTNGQSVVGGETTRDSFHGSLLDGFGDGGIGIEHIRPCHDIATGLLENACAFANVCLADVQEQTALQTAEAVIHFALNIHISFLRRKSENSDCFDFTQNVLGQSLHCAAATSGLADKILCVHFVKCGKVVHVGDEAGGLDHVLIATAGSSQNSAYVLAALLRLSGDAFGDFAGSGNNGDLTGAEHHITGNHALRIGTNCCRCVGSINRIHNAFLLSILI